MDILYLVDKLEKLVQESRKVPMSSNRIISEAAILELIDQMRTTIPEEVKAARVIQQQKERVLAQGKEEANRIIEIAKEQASEIVGGHDITRAAEMRGQTIIERAQREANDIRRGADGYAEQVLMVLDERISHAQHQIRSGLLELANRRNETQGAQAKEDSAAATPPPPTTTPEPATRTVAAKAEVRV